MLPSLSSQFNAKNPKTAVIILAAGQGKRMSSDKSKVLHKVLDQAMIDYVIRSAQQLQAAKICLVLGYQADQVQKHCQSFEGLSFALQEVQLGTGHAVQSAKEKFVDFEGDIFILYGDIPGLRLETLQNLHKEHVRQQNVLTLLTSHLDDPQGYGRIIENNDGELLAIVEEKDADDEQKKIKQINTGIGVYRSDFLWSALQLLKPNNAQKELYLTDLVAIATEQKQKMTSFVLKTSEDALGVNDPDGLAKVEEHLNKRPYNI